MVLEVGLAAIASWLLVCWIACLMLDRFRGGSPIHSTWPLVQVYGVFLVADSLDANSAEPT